MSRFPRDTIQYVTWTKDRGLTIKYWDGLTHTMRNADLEFDVMHDSGVLTEQYEDGVQMLRRVVNSYVTMRFVGDSK